MRVRLILSQILIPSATLLVICFYLNRSLKQMFAEHTMSELESQAHLIREYLSRTLPRNFSYDTVDGLADKLHTENFTRLTFIVPDGAVWGDAAYDGNRLVESKTVETVEKHEGLYLVQIWRAATG